MIETPAPAEPRDSIYARVTVTTGFCRLPDALWDALSTPKGPALENCPLEQRDNTGLLEPPLSRRTFPTV